MDQNLIVQLFTREYPPHVYGGAGVHVAELAKVLRELMQVRVGCFDGPRDEHGVIGVKEPDAAALGNPALAVLAADLALAGHAQGADLVHSHTWYANMAGRWAQLLWGVPHIISAHSLEPMRPWKAEQLGGGYALSSWAESEAYHHADRIIAVSAGMRRDILRCYPDIAPDKVVVVHNGIDLDSWFPMSAAAFEPVLRSRGIDPARRSVVFVGRQTRQKGLPHFLRAARELPEDVQIVLCAGAPDTPEIAREIAGLVDTLRASRSGVVLISEMLPHDEVQAIVSSATVFACPSVYEPLGIVNLEAMACGIPVVATATGGIPEVVQDGVTGWLIEVDQANDGTGAPLDPDAFAADMARTFNDALSDPDRIAAFGAASRARVEEHFTWRAIAQRTMAVYRSVLAARH